jgi:hypothetical protein
LHARTELAVVPNGNFADIEDGAVEVEEYPLAKFYVGPVITEERRLQPSSIPALPKIFKSSSRLNSRSPSRVSVQNLAEVTSAVPCLDQLGV